MAFQSYRSGKRQVPVTRPAVNSIIRLKNEYDIPLARCIQSLLDGFKSRFRCGSISAFSHIIIDVPGIKRQFISPEVNGFSLKTKIAIEIRTWQTHRRFGSPFVFAGGCRL